MSIRCDWCPPRPGRLIEPLVVMVGMGVRRAVLVVALACAGLLAGAAGALAQPAFTPVAGSPFTTGPAGLNPTSVAFSPSGGLLATANSTDGTVSVFSVAAGGALTVVGTPPTEPEAPDSVAFSPSGGLLATANHTNPGTVSVFSVAAGGALTLVGTTPTPARYPVSVAFSPSGGLLATANQASVGSVSVFSVAAGGALTLVGTTPIGPGSNPTSVAFSPDGELLATANHTSPGSVSVFSVAAGGALTLVGTTPTPARYPVSVAFSPSGGLLATANQTSVGSVSVFSVAAGGALTLVGTTPIGPGSNPTSVAFSPDGGLLATANHTSPGTVSVFSVSDVGALTAVGTPVPTDDPFPVSVAFSPSGGLLATANETPSTVSVFAPTGGFVIGKVAYPKEIAPGGVLSYMITVQSAGVTAGSGSVTDDLSGVLDKASFQNDAHASTGTVTFDAANKQLVWTGTLGPGEDATITYSVKIHGSADGLVSNEVAGPRSSCASPSPPELPCITETPIVRPPAPGPDLALTKTASSGTAHPGSQVTFVLAVRNQGPAEATGVTVQDPVPSGLFLHSAQPSQGTCRITADQLLCPLGSLVSGGQALVSVTYTVAAGASGTLVNEASVFGDQPDPHPSNNVARSAITVTPLPVPAPDPGPQPIANLVVTKHVNHSTARVGQTLTYTITVTNAGPNAAHDVRVIDASRQPLKVLSIHPEQGSCTTGRPIRCRLGTLGSHKHTTITITAIAQVAGVQVNAAVATSGSWDPAVSNNLARAKTRITPLVTPPPPRVTG